MWCNFKVSKAHLLRVCLLSLVERLLQHLAILGVTLRKVPHGTLLYKVHTSAQKKRHVVNESLTRSVVQHFAPKQARLRKVVLIARLVPLHVRIYTESQ